jgi:hypothetical protein
MGSDYLRRSFKDGDKIFAEGDRAGEAFLVHSGKVRLFKVENGVSQEIDTVGEGRIFGEMGVLSDMNRMASATAVGDTVLTCCHHRALMKRLDALDSDRRDSLRFLIVYCQEFLPFEMMENRRDDEETRNRDSIAFYLIRDSAKPGELDGLDPFLRGLYQVLVGYAKRRLPPDFEPG